MIATDRWPFLVLREYVGAVGIIAGITHAWPAGIVAIIIGALLVLGVATRWVAGLAAALLTAYSIKLGAIVQAPAVLAALALTVALASTDKLWDWKHGTAPVMATVPARIYFGCAFWRAAWNKIGPKWAAWPDALTSFGTMNLPHEAPSYRAFMTTVVLPHATLFAGLVATGEVVVGTCLLLGLGVRIAAPIGAFLTLNYFLLKGDAPWSVSNDIAFVVGLTVLALTGAGRVFGLDGLIAARHPVEQATQRHEGRIGGR
ncbi:MAG TPA: DoxX family protein [Gemmatimonadaceae bacterium]|nr:DoxX family protein [Gemmatimonadaceae bacterium]